MSEEENEGLGAFERVIREIDAPETDPEKHLSVVLDRSMEAGIQASRASGKKAVVVLKLVIEALPEKRVVFTGTVDARLPRPGFPGVGLFVLEDGTITRKDPAQGEMPEMPLGRRPGRDGAH